MWSNEQEELEQITVQPEFCRTIATLVAPGCYPPAISHEKCIPRCLKVFVYNTRSVAPRTWPLLKPFVDNDFRNALAHGTYALVGKKVMLRRDANLIPFQEMELDEFMMRLKEKNVPFQCLVSVFVDKKRLGFFT